MVSPPAGSSGWSAGYGAPVGCTTITSPRCARHRAAPGDRARPRDGDFGLLITLGLQQVQPRLDLGLGRRAGATNSPSTRSERHETVPMISVAIISPREWVCSAPRRHPTAFIPT